MTEAHNRIVKSEGINDLHRRAHERDSAYKEAAEAFATIFGELALERSASAFAGRTPTEVEGVGPEAIRAARAGVDLDTAIRLEAKDAGGFTMTFEKKRLAKPADHQIYEPLTASLTDQGWECFDAPKTKSNKRSDDRTKMEQLYAQTIDDLTQLKNSHRSRQS
jgi:hypothetical protein